MYGSTQIAFMPRSAKTGPEPRPRRGAVREPVQAYLSADDVGLLSRLVEESGLSKAEILRRGIRSYAREHGAQAEGPMLRFLSSSAEGWPLDVAAKHDAVLAEEYKATKKKRQ